ncbi:hypothetical protein LXA43DRAFT_1094386 [Ganoderma leucocontextum]|nr:hypothetical protein LXA43DRAFT_1094386 [Ganoderma leucocontextum]
MDGHGVHARKEVRAKGGGVAIKRDLFITLVTQKLPSTFIGEWWTDFIPGIRVVVRFFVRIGPETFAQALTNGTHKRLVRVIVKKIFEYGDFDWSYDLKEIGTSIKRGINNRIRAYIRRDDRQGGMCERYINKGTARGVAVIPNKVAKAVSDIQQWTTAKADEYRQFLLALLAIHNLAAPIHRLPTEVLERIFAQCWNDRKSLRLSRVCGLWRSIILGKSAFWADALVNWGFLCLKREVKHDELPFINTLLSRSMRHSPGIKPFFFGFTPSIVKTLTPYISNVASLRVALKAPSDLYDGLWPILRSGMPKLGDLAIDQVIIIKEEDFDDDEDEDFDDDEDEDFDDDEDEDFDSRSYDGEGGSLPILSHKNLSQLSRLTCPPNMVRLFGGVSLRHVTTVGHGDGVQLHRQELSLGTPRHHLEPYRDCLEIVGRVMWDVARPADIEALQLSSLQSLRIGSSYPKVIGAVLSWLALPQTARIHITDGNYRHPLFEEFFTQENSMLLRSVITTIDRVCIQRPPSKHCRESDVMQCFSDDVERLHIEDYYITPEGLLNAFSEHASITHLVLSLGESDSLNIDFRAFPHLVHLDMSGTEMETMSRMLGPADKRKGRAATEPALCPALAELVITCGLTVQRTATAPKPKGRATSSRSESQTDRSTTSGKVFRQSCSFNGSSLVARPPEVASPPWRSVSAQRGYLDSAMTSLKSRRTKGLGSPTRYGPVPLLDRRFSRVFRGW